MKEDILYDFMFVRLKTENSATVTEVRWEGSALKDKRKAAQRMEHFLS